MYDMYVAGWLVGSWLAVFNYMDVIASPQTTDRSHKVRNGDIQSTDRSLSGYEE